MDSVPPSYHFGSITPPPSCYGALPVERYSPALTFTAPLLTILYSFGFPALPRCSVSSILTFPHTSLSQLRFCRLRYPFHHTVCSCQPFCRTFTASPLSFTGSSMLTMHPMTFRNSFTAFLVAGDTCSSSRLVLESFHSLPVPLPMPSAACSVCNKNVSIRHSMQTSYDLRYARCTTDKEQVVPHNTSECDSNTHQGVAD